MFFLFNKEVQGFFSSLTGYMVVSVFLIVTGLCLWVFPGVLNIPQSGYASLESLFFIAPWVFLFLVPAITMRSFAEEIKTGTIELLLTKPISELQIVLAKFFAATALVFIALLPCLIYFYSVWQLGMTPGNLDTGATIGSLIGLLLLGAVYAATGTFTSAMTDNQIIAFIAAAVIAFVFYEGFDVLSELVENPELHDFITYLGIKEHYASISRGVVDMRDIVYFFSVITLFLLVTQMKLKNRA